MSKRFTINIEEDEFGELILPIPDDVCEDLGWIIGDDLEFDVDDVTGTLTLRKVEDQSAARPQRKPHFTAFTQSMIEDENSVIREIDDNFIAISNALKELEKAHKMVDECLITLNNRVQQIEEYIVKLPTPDKILYKPTNSEDHLTLKQNLDLIYLRLQKLEGAQ